VHEPINILCKHPSVWASHFPPSSPTRLRNILFPPEPLYCNIYRTILRMAISCKGQVTHTHNTNKDTNTDRTISPVWMWAPTHWFHRGATVPLCGVRCRACCDHGRSYTSVDRQLHPTVESTRGVSQNSSPAVISLFCAYMHLEHVYLFMSYTGFTRRNTWFIFAWLRHTNTWIPTQHVGPLAQAVLAFGKGFLLFAPY